MSFGAAYLAINLMVECTFNHKIKKSLQIEKQLKHWKEKQLDLVWWDIAQVRL